MTTNLVRQYEISPQAIEASLTGNWGNVSTENKIVFIRNLCDSLGIPLVMNPFMFINMKGKITLYAPASAFHMIANKQNISTQILSREVDEKLMLYEVAVRAVNKEGRYADNFACVSLKGLSGEEYGNAKMKCITKAQRRAIKSLVGLPIPDDEDIEAKSHEVIALDINQDLPNLPKEVTNAKKDEENIDQRTDETRARASEGEQKQEKIKGQEITEADKLEIKQWREHIRAIFLDDANSPFRGDPKSAAQFTINHTGKALQDLNALEMEDLKARFYKKYPAVLELDLLS